MTNDTADQAWGRIGDISGALFGRRLRLPLALWIRKRDGEFFQREAAEGVGVPPQYVGKELGLLVQLGMITQLPRSRGDNRVFYAAEPAHPLWAVIDAAESAANPRSSKSRRST
jgi:hypothetical protein